VESYIPRKTSEIPTSGTKSPYPSVERYLRLSRFTGQGVAVDRLFRANRWRALDLMRLRKTPTSEVVPLQKGLILVHWLGLRLR
jgi:hypothetical protein